MRLVKMIWKSAAIWLLLGLAVERLAAQAEAHVTLEVRCTAQAYESQPVDVVVTIGYDEAWFVEHGVSLFRQPVDVPFHLDIPWLLAAPERAVTLVPATEQQVQIAVGDRMVAGRKLPPIEREGRSFAQVQLRLRWLPLASGVTKLAPVRLRFAYADHFREHLLRGREPVDQQEQTVYSAAKELRVLPVPKEAPAGFSGAVGEFALEATSGGEQVHVGEVFQVEWTIAGEGNRERFAPPQLPKLDGFHVQGMVERRMDGARRFVLDVLALRPGVTEMPGLPFVFFSPEQQAFVTETSKSVPVRVLPQREGMALSKNVQQLIDADAAAQVQGVPSWVVRWGFIALTVLGIWLLRRGRERNGRRALEDAVHKLRLALTQGEDPDRSADAFEHVLAMVAGGGGSFAVPGVWDDLLRRGVAEPGIQQLKALHADLDAARFGGPAPPADAVMAATETLVAASR